MAERLTDKEILEIAAAYALSDSDFQERLSEVTGFSLTALVNLTDSLSVKFDLMLKQVMDNEE